MQHPEEGTIHSWLDGQLPLTQAADIEAHVAGCPACGAVVAEARGFIAASSRILTALDDVPRGVIPAAEPKAGNRRAILRAAAAVLVVAAGSFAVLNRTGSDAGKFDSTADKEATPVLSQSAKSESAESPALDAAVAAAPVSPAPAEIRPTIRTEGKGVTLSGVPTTGAASRINEGRAPATATDRRENSTSVQTDVASQKSSQLQQLVVPRQEIASRAADNALSAPSAAALGDLAGTTSAPRLVRTDSASGTRRTVYEVGAGRTVTLTEASAEAIQFSEKASASGVAGGVAQSAPRLERARGADSRTPVAERTSAAAATPAPAAPMPAAAITVNTISWVDANTRKRLTLSGPFTTEELRAIRARLDALKPGAQKKTP